MSTYKGVVVFSRNNVGCKQEDGTMNMVVWPLSSGTIEIIEPASLSTLHLKMALKSLGQADILEDLTTKEQLVGALVEQLWCEDPIMISPYDNATSVLKEMRTNRKVSEIVEQGKRELEGQKQAKKITEMKKKVAQKKTNQKADHKTKGA